MLQKLLQKGSTKYCKKYIFCIKSWQKFHYVIINSYFCTFFRENYVIKSICFKI